MYKKNKIDPLKLRLQFFSSNGEGTGEGEGQGEGAGSGEGSVEGEGSQTVQLTKEELQKQIEAESDRKLQSALKKQEEKMRAKLEKEVREREEEAARLAKLSQKEREEAEFKKRQEALDKREQELAQKELKSQAVTELQGKQLPSSFADFLLAEDGEKTFENINNFKTAFDEAVNAAVREKLRQEPPETGNQRTQTSNMNKSKAEMARKNRII